MALIKCYECEKEISDKGTRLSALWCPKGGKKDGVYKTYHENGQLQQKLTFIAGPLVFLAVAALACIIPARRVAGIHPAAALRGD